MLAWHATPNNTTLYSKHRQRYGKPRKQRCTAPPLTPKGGSRPPAGTGFPAGGASPLPGQCTAPFPPNGSNSAPAFPLLVLRGQTDIRHTTPTHSPSTAQGGGHRSRQRQPRVADAYRFSHRAALAVASPRSLRTPPATPQQQNEPHTITAGINSPPHQTPPAGRPSLRQRIARGLLSCGPGPGHRSG